MLNRITICSSNSTTGYLSKKMKTIIQKDICTPIFIAALFIIAKKWKRPKCPLTPEWIKKMWYTHTRTHMHTMKYYSAIKKEWNLAIATWMALGGHYAKWNKSDRERQMPYDLTYMWNWKNKETNHQVHKEREQMSGWQRWEWMKWVKGVKRYKLPVIHFKYVLGMWYTAW